MNACVQQAKKNPSLNGWQAGRVGNNLEQIMQRENEFGKFDYFRSLYASIDISEYDPYPIDWSPYFSPIESVAWGEIRCLGLPFWPQFPIGQYFADFADPEKKVVIECDGKEFHSKERDTPRDAFMNANGWCVYRISGADCNRLVNPPWEEILDRSIEDDSAEARCLYDNWFHKTIEGLVMAIAITHYGRDALNEHEQICASSVISARRARGI